MMGKPALFPEGTTIAVSIPGGLLNRLERHPEAEQARAEYRHLLRDCLTRHGVEGAESIMRKTTIGDTATEALPWMGREELVATCLVGAMLLEADDLWERGEQAGRADARRCVEVARGEYAGPLPPFMRAFADVYARYRPFWVAQGWEQAMTALGRWSDLMATDPQVIEERITDFEAYMAVRRIDFGFDTLDLLMRKSSSRLTPWEHPVPGTVSLFQDACCEYAILVNDLFSFPREHFSGEFRNALQVLVSVQEMSLQDAVDEVCRRIVTAESNILALSRENTEGSTGGDMRAWRAYHKSWMTFLAAGLRQHLRDVRYHGADHVWRGEIPTRITLYRDQSEFHYT
ncbi:hypothetical protein [Streptomyces sp. NPDC046261]|uniref:terpene synthase family protein n=1 Tax=Streptomyces sp. NPDC046261 TaxID=3157200 RepID=UPI0033D4FB6A